jgi:hypothetical protein
VSKPGPTIASRPGPMIAKPAPRITLPRSRY